MAHAMAAVSRTPPVKPPIATAIVTQPSTERQLVAHNDITILNTASIIVGYHAIILFQKVYCKHANASYHAGTRMKSSTSATNNFMQWRQVALIQCMITKN